MGPVGVQFEMRQDYDAGGVVRLSLTGELDLATTEELKLRLRSLKEQGASVRLELSGLEFTDSTGLRTLITIAEDAHRAGWALEVGRNVQPEVQRVIELVGASPYLWPSGGDVARDR
jgi:anti-sigma B factor antagonist